jgi:tripartite-type tricarboxylate transporter receptor subunit TctC
MFSNFPVVLPHVRAGKLRALAITSLKRSSLAPEFPTVAEMGIPGFDTATWSGLYVPGGTSRDVVKRIHGDVYKIMHAPEFKKRMLAQGIDQSEADTPEKHAAFLKSEIAKWGKVIREAGVKVE